MTQPPTQPPPPPPPYPYGAYRYPAPPPTNTMAIAALVSAVVFAPLGIVFGHISLSQIKRTGEEGRGLAIAGLVIGYLVTVLTVIAVVVGVVFSTLVIRGFRDSVDPGDAWPTDRITAAPVSQGRPS